MGVFCRLLVARGGVGALAVVGLGGCTSLADLSQGDAGGDETVTATDGLPDASANGASDGARDGPDDGPVLDPLTACAANQTKGVCAPPVPPGWTGPVVLYEGPPAGAVPTCALGYSVDLYDGHGAASSEPAACSACTCDASSVQCATGVTNYSDSACTHSCAGPFEYTKQECLDEFLFEWCSPNYAKVTFGPVGSCAAHGGTANVDPTWGLTVRACASVEAPTQGSCASNEVCLPSPPAPFPARFCVMQPGASACPPTSYREQHLEYAGASDTRACAPCGCGAASGACTGDGAIGTCGNSSSCASCTAVTSSQCFALASGKYLQTQGGVFSGGCTPSGGQATGEVAPSGPTTFCCTR